MEDSSKKNRLLKSAYQLFTKKGINKTTIQDIVDAAKVAKGTFYLYFEDKYHIQEELIVNKSEEIFDNAINELGKHKIKKFDDQVLFVIDYIIDTLSEEKDILNFISKDLSLGLYEEKVNNILSGKETKLYSMFMLGAKENNIKNADVKLFMIFEFLSATLFSLMNNKIDISMKEYKTYMHKIVKEMLHN